MRRGHRRLDQHEHGPRRGQRTWPSLEIHRNTPEYPRELQAGAGELNDPGSPPRRGLAVQLTCPPRAEESTSRANGSFLGCLHREFPYWNIDIDIVEFEIEGGLHVGWAFDAHRGVVLPSQARVIFRRLWQSAMAHLSGTVPAISPILQR